VDRQATFFAPDDYALYLEALAHAAREFECQIHSYVLMTNHTHLLLTPGSERALPLLMQAMGRKYVQTLNRKYDRTGTLWEGRYKASLVQNDLYLLTCQQYIELNPVRAGMTTSPAEYPYSSYAHNAYGKIDPIVTPQPVYLSLGDRPAERQAAYRKLFTDEISTEIIHKIRKTTNACLVLGDDAFKDRIESELGHSVRHRRKGRPRKTRFDPK
jgi:putative transposase